MKQLTIEAFIPVTNDLYCPRCRKNTMVMKSKDNGCGYLYTHPTECTVCHFFVQPCGMKNFILDNWKKGFDDMEKYANLRGFKYEWMKAREEE